MRIGLDELAIPRQVQGGLVQRVHTQGGYDACDGLITNSVGVFLTISAADCPSVFMFDPIHKAIGAVHAGWRGGSMNIMERGTKLMAEEFGTANSDLIAYVSPSAGVCCYEVGADVAKNFKEEFMKRSKTPKPHLDLKLHTKTELLNSGVRESNIEISE